MLVKNIKPCEVHENEICTIMEKASPSSNKFKVHIINLMPLITPSKKSSNAKIDKKIFINDDGCVPSFDSSVSLQGFISVPKYKTASFSGLDKIEEGMRFICNPLMKNVSHIYMTDHLL